MTLLPELAGESPEIIAVREGVRRLLTTLGSGRLPPVLIEGETGTGKGLLARGLYRAGPRSAGPFVPVNCAAIPETLVEAELFGFERGAFTDARQPKAGLLEVAHQGTLFLDEVGLLPPSAQGKLLKAIEDRQVRRLGATHGVPVDVWIIAATSEDLAAARPPRPLQEALYHRLAVLTLRLPPLRQRGADILLLAGRFLGRACAEYHVGDKRLSAEAQRLLLAYPWPGNVRELANVMERVALSGDEAVIAAQRLELASPRSRRPRPRNRRPVRPTRERARATREPRAPRGPSFWPPWSGPAGTSRRPPGFSGSRGTRSATGSSGTCSSLRPGPAAAATHRERRYPRSRSRCFRAARPPAPGPSPRRRTSGRGSLPRPPWASPARSSGTGVA